MSLSYNDCRVLVTGGCSFIGSHLVESLVQEGARVTVVDDLSSGCLQNISAVADKVHFIEGDLRDSAVADRSMRGQQVVFHLANIHGGRGFIETHPGEICQNLLIDGNVFYHAHLHRVARICFASSACAYPTNLQSADPLVQKRYLSEEMADPFLQGAAQADGVYGWAKLMGEMALQSYHRQFGVHGVCCRLFTVYGPRENESHAIIALLAKALARQDPFEIWGSGQQDRNFTYVSDIVHGLKLATHRITDCRAVNLGTDEVTRIADAAKLICELTGHRPQRFHFDTTKPEGVHARAASTQNQQRWLGWKPEVSFRQGICATLEWYRGLRSPEQLLDIVSNRLFER